MTVTIDSKTAGNEYVEKLLTMEANERIPEIVIADPRLVDGNSLLIYQATRMQIILRRVTFMEN